MDFIFAVTLLGTFAMAAISTLTILRFRQHQPVRGWSGILLAFIVIARLGFQSQLLSSEQAAFSIGVASVVVLVMLLIDRVTGYPA